MLLIFLDKKWTVQIGGEIRIISKKLPKETHIRKVETYLRSEEKLDDTKQILRLTADAEPGFLFKHPDRFFLFLFPQAPSFLMNSEMIRSPAKGRRSNELTHPENLPKTRTQFYHLILLM